MPMLRKGTKLYAILKFKCPHCHEGDLFEDPSLLNFSNLAKIPNRCPVCGQDFVIETGFYFGAMYVSYAITVFIALPLFAILYYTTGLTFMKTFFLLVFIQALLTPYLFRLSRSVWINLFVHYKKS